MIDDTPLDVDDPVIERMRAPRSARRRGAARRAPAATRAAGAPEASARPRLPRGPLVVGLVGALVGLAAVASAFVAMSTGGSTAAPSVAQAAARVPVDDASGAPFPSEPAAADGARAPTDPADEGGASGTSTPHPIAALPDADWLRSTAAATGIPERALAAYAGASLWAASERPGCGIGWNTLAAIGWVESQHGALAGGAVGASGEVRPPIIGPALDGDGVALIRDTDRGKLDHDPEFDHAVGPMQFTPQTWFEYRLDGDGNRIRNPHHIDDAAVTAANYLCAVGGDLTDGDHWIAAVRAYNDLSQYVADVAAVATQYATLAD